VAEFPALPLFTDAYLADTRHLTTEEHGAYLLLLMCAWRTRGCRLKDDDKHLARLVGVTPHRWKRLKLSLIDFFNIDQGYWKQKKLSHVHETVASKVEKNRANGAKGGRARALRSQQQAQCRVSHKALEIKKNMVANAEALPTVLLDVGCSETTSKLDSQKQATKTKTKTKKAEVAKFTGSLSKSSAYEKHHTVIAAAAGLDEKELRHDTLAHWHAAGVDFHLDILPVLERLSDREEKRVGQVPASLAYYTKAVLEARDKRVCGVRTGADHASLKPPRPAAQAFDVLNPDHWRELLGDADSKFRGDYMSKNWLISSRHPVFLPANLGPDPRHRFNKYIPSEIYALYGPKWRWQSQP